MPGPLIYRYPPLLTGTLIKRYQRFLADVEVGGKTLTVFCPNSGSMLGLKQPGSKAAISLARPTDVARRTAHTLELLRPPGMRTWVAVNTHLTNHLASRMLTLGLLMPGHSIERAEATLGDSRFDFLLRSNKRRQTYLQTYLEVKSVTLRLGNEAAFPDSVTERGLKHLQGLARIARAGKYRAAALYIVQRTDCGCFRPAQEIDPAYARAFGRAVRAGVEVKVAVVRATMRGVSFEGMMPLCR